MQSLSGPLNVDVRFERNLEADREAPRPSKTDDVPFLLLKAVHSSVDVPAIPLRRGRWTVGSGEQSDIKLTQEGVAENHCVFIVGQRQVIMRAFSPLTWLNDGAIREGTLRMGDRLILGPIEFLVAAVDSASREAGEYATDLSARRKLPTQTARDAESCVYELLSEAAAHRSLNDALERTENQIEIELSRSEDQHSESTLAPLIAQSDLALTMPSESLPLAEPTQSEPETQEDSASLAVAEQISRQEYDAEVFRLRQLLDQREEHLRDREAALKALQAEVTKQQRTRQDRKQTPELSEKQLGERERALNRQTEELDRLRREWSAAHTESCRFRTDATQHHQEWELRLADQKQHWLEKQQEFAQIEEQLQSIRAQQTLRTDELLDREDALCQREADLAQLERSLLERSDDLWGREFAAECLAKELEDREHQLTSLEDELTGRLVECDNRKASLSDWHQHLSTQTVEFFRRSTELDRARDEFDHRESVLKAAEAALQEKLQAMDAELAARHVSWETRNAAHADRVAAWQSEFDEQSRQLEQARALCQTDRDHLGRTLAQLTEEVAQTELELAQRRTDRDQLVSELDQLRLEQAQVQTDRTQLAEALAKFEQEKTQLQAERTRFQWDLSQIEAHRTQLTDDRFAHDSRVQQFSSQFAEHHAQFAEYTQQIADWERRGAAYERQVSDLRQQLDDLVNRRENASELLPHRADSEGVSATALETIPNQLRREWDAQRTQFEVQIRALETQLADSQQFRAGRHDVNPQLAAQLQALIRERESLASVRDEVEQRRLAFEQDELRRGQEQTLLDQQRQKLSEELAQVEAERDAFLSQRQSLIHDRQALDERSAKLAEDLAALEERNRHFTATTEKVREQEALIAQQKSEIEAERAVLERQRQQLLDYGQSLVAGDVVSAPAAISTENVVSELPIADESRLEAVDHKVPVLKGPAEEEPSTPVPAQNLDSILSKYGFTKPHAESPPPSEEPAVETETASEPSEEKSGEVANLRSHLASLFGLAVENSPTNDQPAETSVEEPWPEIASAEPEAVSEPEVAAELEESQTNEVRSEQVEPTETEEQPASDPAAAEETEEDEAADSVAAYMERLLARSRRSSTETASQIPVKKSRAKSSAHGEPPIPSVPAILETEEPAAPIRKNMNSEQKEKFRANMDSFREVANLNARTSVAKHRTQRMRLEFKVRMAVTGVTCILAITLLTGDIWGRNNYLWEGLLSAVVTVSMLGLTLVKWIELQRAQTVDGKRLTPSAEKDSKPQ